MSNDGTIGALYVDNVEGREPSVEVWYGGRYVTDLKPSRVPTEGNRDREFVAHETLATTMSEIFKWWRLSGGVEKIHEAQDTIKDYVEATTPPEEIDTEAIKKAAEVEHADVVQRRQEVYASHIDNITMCEYANTMVEIAEEWVHEGSVAAIKYAARVTHSQAPIDPVARARQQVKVEAARSWLAQREPLVQRAMRLGDEDTRIEIITSLVGGIE